MNEWQAKNIRTLTSKLDWVHRFPNLLPLGSALLSVFWVYLGDWQMQIVSLSLIPTKQWWWVCKEPACLSTKLLFCSSLEGYRITHGDPCLRHSRQALACSCRWVRTRAIGRRTRWVHLALYLRNWPDLVPSSVFGHSEKHRTISRGAWRLCGEQCALILGRNTWLAQRPQRREPLLLSVFGGPWRPWQWGPWHVVERKTSEPESCCVTSGE